MKGKYAIRLRALVRVRTLFCAVAVLAMSLTAWAFFLNVQIPRGSSGVVASDGTDAPANAELWDIVAPGSGIVATASQPNGWSVSSTGATGSSKNIGVPQGAAIATGFQYRFDPGAGPGTPISPGPISGHFDVVDNANIPAAPSLSAAAVSTSQIELNWSESSSPVTSFKLERKIPGGTYAEIAVVAGTANTYRDMNLGVNTAYTYRMRAFNGSLYSDYSNEVTQTTLPYPPNSPSNLTATTVSTRQIDLSWSDNSSDEDGFAIERKYVNPSTNLARWETVDLTPANATAYSALYLDQNSTYTFRVVAFNRGGDSGPSNEATATTIGIGAPLPPSNLTATTTSDTGVLLAWSDNSTNEAGFSIERADGPSGSFREVAQVSSNTTTFPDSTLEPATLYRYRLRAFNNGGYSLYSNTASATTTTGSPIPPGSIQVFATSSTSIRAYWSRVPGAISYKVFRATTSGGYNYSAPVATVTANLNQTLFFDDSGLTTGQDYFYVVKSVFATGESAASMEDSHFPNAEAIPWNATPIAVAEAVYNLANSAEGNLIPIPPGNTFVLTPQNEVINDATFAPVPNTASWDPQKRTMTDGNQTVAAFWDTYALVQNPPALKAEGAYWKVAATPTDSPALVGASGTFVLPSSDASNSANFQLNQRTEAPHCYFGFASLSTGVQLEGGVMFHSNASDNKGNRWQAYLRVADNRPKATEYEAHPILFNLNGPSIAGDSLIGGYAHVVLKINPRARIVIVNVFGGDVYGLYFLRSFAIPMRFDMEFIGGNRALRDPQLRRVISIAQSATTPGTTRFFDNPPPDGWPNAYRITGSRVKGFGYTGSRLYKNAVEAQWYDAATGWNVPGAYRAKPCVTTGVTGGTEPTQTVSIVHSATGG